LKETTTTMSTTTCNHDWQPIPNWYARYRCSICRVIGGKFGVICARYGVRGGEIRPYRCCARPRGAQCPNPAVHNDHGTNFRCTEHVRREHAASARKQIAAAKPAVSEERADSTAPLSTSAPASEMSER
jgi:hypothetical protein